MAATAQVKVKLGESNKSEMAVGTSAGLREGQNWSHCE